jgi:Holliday junction resolvase RusA-like endonuclease
MKIIIPGIPVPQARMKHCSRGTFVQTYDPRAKQKTLIRTIMLCFKTGEEIDFPRISFLFHMPIPASIPKKHRPFYESGTVKHDKKPDVDNLIKLYLDCLDGIVIQGDQKVSLGPCIKVYHPEPKTIIWIHETTQKLGPWEMDSAFLGVLEPDIPSFCALDYLHGSESLWFQVRSLFDRNYSPPDTMPALDPLEKTHFHQE